MELRVQESGCTPLLDFNINNAEEHTTLFCYSCSGITVGCCQIPSLIKALKKKKKKKVYISSCISVDEGNQWMVAQDKK